MTTTITTIEQLVDALGGDTIIAEEFGISQPAVAQWKSRGFIPGGWHLRLWAWAKRKHLIVDPKVFGLSRQEAEDLFGALPKPRRGAFRAAVTSV